jgi:putative two-component system response regulator
MSMHPLPNVNLVQPPDPVMLALQAERYAEDLRTLRQQRNSARAALKEARLDALLRLAAAVEHKDNDTGLHVVRMGHFSAAIALAMGQSADWSEQLLYASRMHDVGKIGVPDAILQKRGPLTPEEWLVMRRHPEMGATLLGGSDSPLFRMAAEVAQHHHEKFDGSGYPAGRSGLDIPLSARVVAVADFFDAVTSDRCYRKAMPDEQAFELLRKGSGGHFDPDVVAAFFSATLEILRLRTGINAGEIEANAAQGDRS